MPSTGQNHVPAPRRPRLTGQEEAATMALTPSAFLREMSFTTEQRLANTRDMRPPRIIQMLDMSETTHQKFSSVDVEQALFQPFPSELIFQNYVPCETYEVPLVLRNNDKVPRLVKVTQESSPYFQVVSPNDVCHKVAPGMASTFRVLFTPEENKDYIHELICITEREKFVVPVRAIGARALLDFPDQISFEICPVKYNTQKTLLVRNIGNREARFQLLTQRPFQVEPESAVLDAGSSLQLSVEFLPLQVGDHRHQMVIRYDTGEDLHVALYGAAADVNMRLDRNSLTIEKTFLSLAGQRSVTIHNRSDVIAHFKWKEFPSEEEEEREKQRLRCELLMEEEQETDRFLDECGADLSLRERLSLLSRTFHNRRRAAEANAMLFSDTVFQLEPMEGDVWPNSSLQVTVLFRPRAARMYQRTVYCDITGREARLPLRLRGEGLGPKLVFSFAELDIGKVFLGSTHNYEVILTNHGAIDGIFSLAPRTSALASCFSFTPSEGIILPDGHQAVQIALCCHLLGDFSEDFPFLVDGSPEDVTLTIRGCIIGPTFHFSVPALHFGDVSFGFPQTLCCSLNNTSLVPMSFSLRVPGDGSGDPSITSHTRILEDKAAPWRRRQHGGRTPQEFTITPCTGTIRSQGLLNIEVTLCSNTLKKYELALVVDVAGIGEEVLALPVTARCLVPPLFVENVAVTYNRCFLRFPYERSVTVHNPSSLRGCYVFLPQESDSSSGVWYDSPQPRGIVDAHSSVDIPIVMRAQRTGELSTKAYTAVYGSPQPPLDVTLLCTGEGPVVHVDPSEVDFGDITVLTEVFRTVSLCNQSQISAPFQASMMRKRSLWRVEPSCGEVPPEGEVQLTLVACLDDTVAFRDTVQLLITDSSTYLIPVRAAGTGTTIVTDRPFAPVLNLGSHFSAGPCRYHFTMTNRGRRTHQLYWMTEGFPHFSKRQQLPSLKPGPPQSSEPGGPMFRLLPSRMELNPGQSIDVVLEGSCGTPKMVKERLLGHAIIGKQSGKERIMAAEVTCEFITPVLHLSKPSLHFYVEKPPEEELKEKIESVILRNVSSLPLTILLSLKPPFSLYHSSVIQEDDEESPLHLDTGEEVELTVRFDPSFIVDLQSQVVEEVVSIGFVEHPHTEQLTLRAEVHFPNLHLTYTHIHFGCILNDTEMMRELEVTNVSPLAVQYRWAFVPETRLPEPSDRPGGIGDDCDPAGGQDEPYKPRVPAADTWTQILDPQPQTDTPGTGDGAPVAEERGTTGVQEVFDILPQFGTLQPGESRVVSFTFYGHTNVSARARAVCTVYGGPVYEVSLHGEASLVTYDLSTREIDCGVQMMDQVVEAQIVLRNTGRVSFPFTVLKQRAERQQSLYPGEPRVQPLSGLVPAEGEEILRVSYFPAVPDTFQRFIHLQVAHLEPEVIVLRGEGVFPRVSLDLPRHLAAGDRFDPFLAAAEQLSGGEPEPGAGADPQLMMEVERLLIRKHAEDELDMGITGDSTQKLRRRLLMADLPEYLLDFGYVIMGEVRSHIIKVTNTGHFPVSFRAERRGLAGTGFIVDLDRVKNLPCGQTETFWVKFDPQGANLPLGAVDVVLHIQVSGGPWWSVRLRALVTMPTLSVSEERVEFSPVQCGQCKIRTVQLSNPLPVPCEWTLMDLEADVKIDKHLPMHLRKKLRQEAKPRSAIFEVIPAHERLLPGQKKNVEIKFMPREEKLYSQRLVLQVTQSSQRALILVQGQGLEPRLDFTPSVLELGPILPLSSGDDVEVLVRNPCSFPIEFYSLEMDKDYMEEEKVLQLLKGYDAQKTLLLPPRSAGDKLPPEILEYYEERRRLQEEQQRGQGASGTEEGAVFGADVEPASDQDDRAELPPAQRFPASTSGAEGGSSTREAEEDTGPGENVCRNDGSKCVGDLERNPVSSAIARYMGIDTSIEGQAARNRRGIAIIVHGAPLTGKSSAAVALAQHYNVVCLSINSVVLEAISDENHSAGLKARQLCAKAAAAQALRESEEAASMGDSPSGQTTLSVEALAKHTAEGAPEPRVAPHSVTSRGNRGKGKLESHQISGAKQHLSEQPASQSGGSPLPGPVPCRLSVGSDLLSCALPEDLLLEILCERLQLSDCFGGVVLDGLDTLFARSPSSALHIVLKALNNRQHLYLINLWQDHATMKAREAARQQQDEQAQLWLQAQEKASMEEMDEEQYDQLPADEKARIEGLRLRAVKERKRREQEQRQIREEQERKLQEEMAKQREEEELRRKSKRGKSRDSEKEGKKSQAGNKQNLLTVKTEQRLDSGTERKLSMNRTDSVQNESDDGRRKKPRDFLQHVSVQDDRDPESETDKPLLQRFKVYESSQKEILHILTFWDRVQGVLIPPATTEDGPHEGEEQAPERQAPERQAPSGKKYRKDRERQEKMEREKAEKERVEKEKLRAAAEDVGVHVDPEKKGEENLEEELKIGVGVPHYELRVTGEPDASQRTVLQSGFLPSVDDVLEGLGLGPSGPPVPPPYLFSVITFPERRTMSADPETLGHFSFIAASPDDPNVIPEVQKDPEPEPEAVSTVPTLKEEQVTPTKSRSKKEKAADSGRESQKEKRRSSSLRKTQQNLESRSPPPGARTPLSDMDRSSVTGEALPQKLPRLGIFRWVVPAGGEVPLRIHFQSNHTGNFDLTLNFELVGTHRRYQLYCRGVCAFPTISKDPKIVFPHRKKEIQSEEIVHKKFILGSATFHFGPLLCGKSRDKYKAGQYPENMEKVTICNVSPLDSDITFCFQYDMKAATFILDPPTMSLKPGEKQELSVWAYPTAPGVFDDNIVCCIKDNPEPVIFHVCCRGVRPELDLDRKQVHFEKMLLHRKDTKTVFLRNSTFLPAAWRVTGLENLGDDFSVSQDQGIVAPRSEFGLQLYFKAGKATNIKKFIRLEVSDVENILGIVQLENIHVFAESYDVALDISFPKGTDGGLDFGVVKILEESKHSLSLKNKGKYEIGFSFSLEASAPGQPDLSSIFSVLPQKGTLSPSDRATQVQIVFQTKKEVQIVDKPLLKCQVIDPILSDTGETIASIPIRISVSSAYAKYRISPSSDVNFGAMVLGSRRLCSFTLENCGLLEFRYNLSKIIREVVIQPTKKGPAHGTKRARSREGSGSSRSVSMSKTKRADSQLRDASISGQARFALGMFVMVPGTGTVPPGGQQIINVECVADQMGKSEELLTLDISDRHPDDHPSGLPFRLLSEVCTPGFITDDIASIFEEHRIVRDSRILQDLPPLQCGGIYLHQENRFLFWNVLVGQTSTARFKMVNSGKVPCDVALTVKPLSAKSVVRISEIFEVQPPRMSIPSHSHSYASVSFTPHSMQAYQCSFEATVEGITSLLSKSRTLTFDIGGEGSLPRVTILRPTLRDKHGNPVLLFQRLLIGQSQQLPLVLKNEGSVPAQLIIDLPEDGRAFCLKPKPDTHCIYPAWTEAGNLEQSGAGLRAHTASLILRPGETAEFEVLFCPPEALCYGGALLVSVLDNQYEKSRVQLVGEGYKEDLTLDNIHSLGALVERPLEDELVEAARTEHIVFGDCHIGHQYQVTFTMTNRSQADAMRFEWPSETPLEFSPQVGHIHAGCAKDVTVTLKSAVAVALHKSRVMCRVSRISFPRPLHQVSDWDDRLRTVTWVDSGKGAAGQHRKKKVIVTDPEPAHMLLDAEPREVELLFTATVDYARYTAKCEHVHFRDTLLYQTRVYKFLMQNTGPVQLQVSWNVHMEGQRIPGAAGPGEPLGSTRGSSTTGRPSSALESVSSLLSMGAAATPFSVQPPSAVIPAGENHEFLIKFSPTHVGEFEGCLTCSIPNMSPEEQEPVLPVTGRSLLPYCHFQLEDSDYISSGRRNPELCGPRGAPSGTTLDPNTRVIEFMSVGVQTKSSRTFSIVNPTNSRYSFLWTCEDPPSLQSPPAFHCLNQEGEIQAEKKVEITFQFHPQVLDVTESFWKFSILEQNISVPFLLVGNASEPSVSLDRSHLRLGSLLLGQEVQESIYIINSEKKTFSFAFRDSSRFSEGCSHSLTVSPMEGAIPPQSRVPISLHFRPSTVGEVNFNLICDVKTKTEPLYLNVKADAHSTQVSVQCQDHTGSITLLSVLEPRELDLGQVDINDRSTLQFHITNKGQFSFSYSCALSVPRGLQDFLTVSPSSGVVVPGQQAQASLTFSPTRQCTVRDVLLTLKIENGPEITCPLRGAAVQPGIHFSFKEHNFGHCFIFHAGMHPVREILVITNKDSRPVSIDCLYSNTAHMELDFSAHVLLPGDKMEVPVTFYPRAAVFYQEAVVFQMNGHSQQQIQLHGHGIEMKVEVVDPKYKVLNFGAVNIGQSVRREITIVNRSPAPVSCTLHLSPSVPALQDPKVLSLSPSGDIKLPAHGGRCKLELHFNPQSRIAPFVEEVMLESCGVMRSLFVVKGCSQGLALGLDQDYMSFGAVVLQSQATRRIVLSNTGELGARFQWDVTQFAPDFSISPASGYITAGTEVTFDVVFHPAEISSDIHYKNLLCCIEGGRTLALTLSGSCVGLPSMKEVVNFQCQVRSKQTQTIALSNKTNQTWHLLPVIDGEHWSGADFITVEAHQQNKPYVITYHPLLMSAEGRKHQGSLFFPLPDGTGLLYLLHGQAEPPKSSGSVIREVPCKTSYTELLSVSNWLRKTQRFRAIVEILKPERMDSATTIKGLDYVEVPGGARRDYKLNFHSHKEGTFSTKVTFRNESTQEYMFYYVTFKATAPGIVSTIELVTPVRQSTAATVCVENPLCAPVTFTTDCRVPEINLPPHITVPAQSEFTNKQINVFDPSKSVKPDSSIPNMSPEEQEPVLPVTGRSLLPYCHFQLEDSDYISSGRRNPELCGPRGAPSGTTLDPNTRVIEFMSVGVQTKSSRTFSIVNPTNSRYSFLWTCEDPPSLQSPPAFHCLNQEGEIQAEKKVEITFQFHPQVLDVTESFWKFSILEQNISVPFLLVGNASEPSVSLDRSHLRLGSLLLGQEVQESIYIINSEKKTFSFAFRDSSRFSEGCSHSLTVSPMEGAIPPQSRVPISLHFRPSTVGEVNFNLICDVKTKTEPLYLNVKADAHSTQVSVQCQDHTGSITLLSALEPRELDLGQVDINDRSTLQFHITNKGQFSFSYSCALSVPRGLQDFLTVSPSSGVVVPGQQAQASLTFSPTRQCTVRDVLLTLKIENGPEITCPLRGAAVQPGIHFSFKEHNFGHCFIFHAGMQPVREILVITNKDSRPVSIDCLYSNTAHMELDFSAHVLLPGDKMEVPVTFYPRAAVFYQEAVVFQMNGHSQQQIQLHGHGIEMKVEVVDPKYKVLNFGAVNIGQSVRREITIVNRSPAPVSCTLHLSPSVPALQDPKVLSLSPSGDIKLPAHGGRCKLELHFNPQSRIAPFVEEVMLESCGVMRSLFVVKGCSQGLALGLDQDYMSFGAVVLQSQATRRIVLSNTGELGARFQWDVTQFAPDFSISPASGYITAGTEVTFDVVFHPAEISSDIHYKNLLCCIEGGRTLALTLSGSCVGLPSMKEVVNFQCQVRSKQTQTIALSNKTNQTWHLLPVIDGEHWSGADFITVEAHQQNKPYVITYHPLLMSAEGRKHQGSLFFPLPDGTGLLYLLHGQAEPPKSSGSVIREVPCKTSYTELLSVSNWLRKTQRFRAIVEILKPERMDSATTIKGLDYVEVPGGARRDYKLNFHSHKEGTFSTKVTFRNESTQEYMFYYVTFKATAPGIVSTIELVTPVRQSTAATVCVENPLCAPVTFTTDCRVPEINLPPHITVPAQSEGTLMFEYQPLRTGESTGRLTLQSNDLGLFQYDLLLKATPAVSEQPLYFRTTLGSSQILSARFMNFTRQKTEYSCKVDNSDFHVDKVVMAAPGSQGGSEVSVEVTYEPVQLGESRCVLHISSALGGEYTIPMFGSAIAPKPQGPLQIRAGSTVSIPFKNVFLQPTTFSFQTDPAAFVVKPCEPVRPKKTHYISVSYEAPHGGSRTPVTGRLVVSCPRATGVAQGIYWVYYLKGVPSEK
ncbi:hydrocephalus-inducing protein homolog [Anomaloglossus baeobatrachus]|uniref:hydrocephalus-inducing protein homolog n=1 Tax=Anomaloglossus baeobatrachus TaxID=238106 RepID=UPI003F4F8F7C